jgi:MoaA/NifB/PqqE/SkfB family radical SAM enzyme
MTNPAIQPQPEDWKEKEQEVVRLYQIGEFENANAIALGLLKQYQSYWLLRAKAVLSFQLRHFEQGLAYADAAIAKEPANPEAYRTKIDLLIQLNRREATVQCCNELLLLDPSSPDIFQIKAEAYDAVGKTVFADLEYRNYLGRRFGIGKGIQNLSLSDVRHHVNHLRMQASPHSQYPAHVAFETFAVCNAACTFCVYPDLERKGELMPMSLIDKIIADLEQIPRHVKFQLSPFVVNEPFLDKRIFEILDKISEKLPNADITLASNASPITLAILQKLSRCKVDRLWLNVVDYREEVYEEKMKLSYDQLLKRLDMIHKARQDGWFSCRTVMSRLADGSEHDRKYCEFFAERYPLFEIGLSPYTDWLGRTANQAASPVPNIPCAQWFDFHIDAKGIVQHCCMDGHGEYPWGDVNKNSILDIYNSPACKKLRQETFSRLEVDPCRRCNLR